MIVYGKCDCFVMQMICVSCVHPVAVLTPAFSMACSLLMLVEDARGDHMEEAYSSAFIICRGLCACTEMF